MSRIYEKTQILISDDVSNEPKQVRFNEISEETDISSLKKTRVIDDTFPVGTNSIALGGITAGKFIWLKASADVGLVINAAPTPITLTANKAHKLWASFTQLDLEVPNTTQNTSNPPMVSLVIGG